MFEDRCLNSRQSDDLETFLAVGLPAVMYPPPTLGPHIFCGYEELERLYVGCGHFSGGYIHSFYC